MPMVGSTVSERREPAAATMLPLVLLAAVLGCASIAMGAPGWRVLVLLLLAPAAEEVVFRAGLHEALLRRAVHPVLANAAVAVAFSIAHLAARPSLSSAAVLLPALAIGWIYQRTRRVAPCVALHAAMNALWMSWELVS
jgi:membrane protease YdiL (CAAX protease family)